MAKLFKFILEGNFNNKLKFIFDKISFIINKISCLIPLLS